MSQSVPEGPSAALAFWAKNMIVVRNGRMDWPGFSYTVDEWSRLAVLGRGVGDRSYALYKVVNAAIFIAIAAAVMVAVFLPAATFLFPVPAETSALKFTLLLAAYCFVTLGFGLPVSLRLAARLCADAGALATVPRSGQDGPLAAKVSWQIGRMSLMLCGLLVPGVVVFIVY